MIHDLIEALHEAIEHSQGKVVLETHTYHAPDIQKLRTQYHLTQADFAQLFGISIRTLQQWEQGRRHPQGPAQVLLNLIARKPDVIYEVLHRKP